VTFINFWATWCPPCRAEIPTLIALQERYRDHLTIVGVSEDEDAVDVVKQFVAERRMNYPIVMSTPELQTAFPGVVSLPTTFVLDKELRIVQKHIGLLPSAETESEARALAGLPVNASVQYVDRDQPVGLANAAQAKEIPGVDLSKLTPQQRVKVLVRLNEEACECGCGLTVAKCRIDDPACGVSLPLARRIVAEMAAKPAS
jgi:thiol-disulfide isomerase/thioredoxin